jgi:hypothetical protein
MVTGGFLAMNQPNFKQMGFKELKKYVLSHREDKEAWDEYTSRPRPNSILISADTPLAEQKQIFDDLIKQYKSS